MLANTRTDAFIFARMSDAGDDIQVEAAPEAEVSTEAPKGKLSIEEALQACAVESH